MKKKTINVNGKPFSYLGEEGDKYIFEKMQAKDGENLLSLAKKLLSTLEIEYFLIYGTLLGAVREGHIIKGDDDIDIAIFSKDEDRLYNALPYLAENGLFINRIFSSELYSFHASERKGHIDIYLVNEFGPSLWRPFCYTICNHSIPKRFLNDFSIVKLGSDEHRCPADPEKVLAWLYGKDWRIPQAKKGKQDVLLRRIWLFPAWTFRKAKKIPRKLKSIICQPQ